MTKTIEEAAKRFADMKTTKQAGSSVERDKKALLMTQFFRYALGELPLSERLTAEEKEKVKRTLNMYYGKWREHPNEATEAVYCTVKETFEAMFGSDFFKEG